MPLRMRFITCGYFFKDKFMLNIRKLTFINFCTRFHFYIHVYALLLQSRGLTLLEISTIESVVILTMFLMEVPTGVLADRLGRRWSVSLWVLLMLSGELLFLFSNSYPLYLVVAALTGTGFAFGSGATEALIYDSLPPEDREQNMSRVMGRYSSAGQIAFFLSPIVGALVVGDLAPERFNWAIALTVAALGVGFLVSLTLREPPSPWHTDRPGALKIFRDSLAEVRASQALRRLILIVVLTLSFTGVLITTLAAPTMTHNGVPPFAIGLALSLGSLLAAFTQQQAHRVEKWLGTGRAFAVLTLLPGLLYLLLAAASGSVLTWGLITLMYGVNDMRAPLLSAHQNRLISSERRATVLSLTNMALSLFVAIMGPVYGALATQSLPLAFAVMGGVILVAGFTLRVWRIGNGHTAAA